MSKILDLWQSSLVDLKTSIMRLVSHDDKSPEAIDKCQVSLQKLFDLVEGAKGVIISYPLATEVIDLFNQFNKIIDQGDVNSEDNKAVIKSFMDTLDKAIMEADKVRAGNKQNKSTTINISSSQGIQVGDNNIQTITSSINSLIEEIDKTNVSNVEKIEAKGKLKELICNPTVAAILGAATSGLLALLK